MPVRKNVLIHIKSSFVKFEKTIPCSKQLPKRKHIGLSKNTSCTIDYLRLAFRFFTGKSEGETRGEQFSLQIS